jgi:DNA-binding FadR family transcriptional regulator
MAGKKGGFLASMLSGDKGAEAAPEEEDYSAEEQLLEAIAEKDPAAMRSAMRRCMDAGEPAEEAMMDMEAEE